MSDYKFYMQKVEWDSTTKEYINVDGTLRDLEVDFVGLRYSKCEGLNNIGERRVYTEEYADDNRTRVYMSNIPTYKAADVKLTLYFVGEHKQAVYDSFNEYIMDGFHAYWDTARNKKVIFYISKPITPSQDVYKGSTPYIEVTYTLSNVYGNTIGITTNV